jgi:CheY-like chemotaxis protein
MAGPGRAKLAATLEEIGQAAYRASHLTGQLLTFSRKHVADIHVLDLGAVIQDMETMLRRLIREDIAVAIESGPGEHRIDADRMQIEQVLVNLVVNASDAMPDGGRLILRLGTASLDDAYVAQHLGATAGPHVVMTVADSGVGMDEETLEHLFEPFFTTKPFGTGTGLGLSIVYGIVQKAGGHITVESQPGRGSTFRLYFPSAHGSPTGSTGPLDLEWERGTETILLCEDEASVRALLGAVLRASGYAVIEARDGETAIRLAKDHTGAIDMLITDVVMPGMKGDRVAAAVLKERPAVRVLFMSGYASDVLSAESITERSLEFLQKPFGPQVLLQRVREILDKAEDR